MLGSAILYLKGMMRMMFQLSGFYYRVRLGFRVQGLGVWVWVEEVSRNARLFLLRMKPWVPFYGPLSLGSLYT